MPRPNGFRTDAELKLDRLLEEKKRMEKLVRLANLFHSLLQTVYDIQRTESDKEAVRLAEDLDDKVSDLANIYYLWEDLVDVYKDMVKTENKNW